MRLFSQDTKVRALAAAPLFEGLSRKELTQLAKITEDMEIGQGKVLCKEGTNGHEFFVIVEGTVEVTKDGRTIATLGPGDFIGEIALIQQGPRTATATAKTPVRLFALTSQGFFSMLDANPPIERKVLRTLAKRLARTSEAPV